MSLEAAIAAAWPPAAWADTHVVVALSGGADSSALLAALTNLKRPGPGEIVAAHFNHGLRGAAGNADEAFVREFGGKLGVRVVVGRGEVASAGDGIEAAAREARYDFLLSAAQQLGSRYVATAHTADDQIETVLHRILRGTGIAGLAGMRAARPLSHTVTLVRPLLSLRRADVLAYLAARGLPHRDDETNANSQFTRNRLRHELLPHLRANYNSDVDAAILRLAQLAGESQGVIGPLAAELYEQAVSAADEQVVVSPAALRHAPRYLVREVFVNIWRANRWPQQALGLAELDSLADLLAADAASAPQQRTLPGNIRATKKGEQLALTRLEKRSST